jgi:hypothetical protein
VGVCLRQTSTIDDVVQQKLSGFKNGEALSDKDKLVLSKRKLLRDVKTKVFDLTKGEHFSVTGIKKKALDLTAEMIASYNAPSLNPVDNLLSPMSGWRGWQLTCVEAQSAGVRGRRKPSRSTTSTHWARSPHRATSILFLK